VSQEKSLKHESRLQGFALEIKIAAVSLLDHEEKKPSDVTLRKKTKKGQFLDAPRRKGPTDVLK